MKQNANSRRSGQIAREKLASILLFEVADPDLDLVTLTGCEVSVDRSFVRAYVTCEPERYDTVMAALERAKGRIRSLLGHALGWRVTPHSPSTPPRTRPSASPEPSSSARPPSMSRRTSLATQSWPSPGIRTLATRLQRRSRSNERR